MALGAVIAIQDMGARVSSSSAVEMGAKGNLGIELDLDALLLAANFVITAYEMMLQKARSARRPRCAQQEQVAEAIFKNGLDFAIVGKTMVFLCASVVKHRGEVKVDLPIKELGDQERLRRTATDALRKRSVLDPASIAPAMSNLGGRAAGVAGDAGIMLQTLGLGAI